MFVVLASAGLYEAFKQSDLQGQIIVVVLFLGSAVSWSVMLTKWQQLRRARAAGEEFLRHFRRERDPLHLFINNYEQPHSPMFNIYRLGAEEISTQLGQRQRVGVGATAHGMLPLQTQSEPGSESGTVKIDTLHNALGRAIDAEIIKLEAHLPVLSTAVQGGPFLGLLGSAWGVMSVFAGMAEQGTVRLQAVAPGISAALAATVVGLLVAVPSLFAYNYLAARVRHQTMVLEDFADELVAAVEHTYQTR